MADNAPPVSAAAVQPFAIFHTTVDGVLHSGEVNLATGEVRWYHPSTDSMVAGRMDVSNDAKEYARRLDARREAAIKQEQQEMKTSMVARLRKFTETYTDGIDSQLRALELLMDNCCHCTQHWWSPDQIRAEAKRLCSELPDGGEARFAAWTKQCMLRAEERSIMRERLLFDM